MEEAFHEIMLVLSIQASCLVKAAVGSSNRCHSIKHSTKKLCS
jgi:hypothetical protein